MIDLGVGGLKWLDGRCVAKEAAQEAAERAAKEITEEAAERAVKESIEEGAEQAAKGGADVKRIDEIKVEFNYNSKHDENEFA